ncbi:MAG: hypothetical protein R3E79_17325 [Caldilineaceae bacterium]
MSTNNGTTDTRLNTNGAGPTSTEEASRRQWRCSRHKENGAGNVRAADIVGEMQTAYLDYAMSVIVARRLCPTCAMGCAIHRRILYAMSHDLEPDLR